MDYKFFIATFKEAVESKIQDPRGRLTRLIKYLKGEAKEMVRHCIHIDSDDCFDNAMMPLKSHFLRLFQEGVVESSKLEVWRCCWF